MNNAAPRRFPRTNNKDQPSQNLGSPTPNLGKTPLQAPGNSTSISRTGRPGAGKANEQPASPIAAEERQNATATAAVEVALETSASSEPTSA